MDGGFVADGELVVSGGHGTVALEPVDTAFHGVSLLALLLVEGQGLPPELPFFFQAATRSFCSGMVQRIPRRRRYPRFAQGPYALSPRMRSRRVPGRPPRGRGTLIFPRTG